MVKVEGSSQQDLVDAFTARNAALGVIGLGYVGMPLALTAAEAGFRVLGFDCDEGKVETVQQGVLPDVGDGNGKALPDECRDRLAATTDMGRLAEVDAAILCVPTPLNKQGEPALDNVVSAAEAIAASLRKGQLVVLESTTYPGTTEEVLLPLLNANGLQVGSDYFLAFAPERIDPGNRQFTLAQIPRVVGGITPACREVACALYSQLVERVVPVSSARAAEMAKLLENTFRNVNIALVNELAQLCGRWDIDIWEVIHAASSKPFGFMPFYPGPGVGGHCIPVDPVYLAWRARQSGMESRFIELARHINANMPQYVVQRTMEALNDESKPLKGSRVLVLGVAYKPNIGDARESPALAIINELQRRGAVVEYSDPHVPGFSVNGTMLHSVDLTAECLSAADCVLIVTDHSDFDWEMVGSTAALVVDTRNALANGHKARVVRL